MGSLFKACLCLEDDSAELMVQFGNEFGKFGNSVRKVRELSSVRSGVSSGINLTKVLGLRMRLFGNG